MSEHIVAIFATENEANMAARDLEATGIPASSIRHYRPQSTTADSSDRVAGERASGHGGGGFWAWLLGEEPTSETTRPAYPRDDEWYDRRAHAGNAVLSVMVHDDSQIHQALTILESHQPIEIEESTDERETDATWGMGSSPAPILGSAHPAAGVGDATAGRAAGVSTSEEVIPLAEENIEVGKRTVDRGTTRIRRYVVETPVEREVTLHGERVTIERRRPVDATVAGGHAFEERTVEVRETEEVPVVEKTTRVAEEVAVRKEETDRTETVRDTVRREEVEVTDKDGRPASVR